jgi:predicted transcriptional regulator
LFEPPQVFSRALTHRPAGRSAGRPSARLADVVERMRRQNLTNLPVTNSDGRLVGLLLRADAEQALEAIQSNAEAARPSA